MTTKLFPALFLCSVIISFIISDRGTKGHFRYGKEIDDVSDQDYLYQRTVARGLLSKLKRIAAKGTAQQERLMTKKTSGLKLNEGR